MSLLFGDLERCKPEASRIRFSLSFPSSGNRLICTFAVVSPE